MKKLLFLCFLGLTQQLAFAQIESNTFKTNATESSSFSYSKYINDLVKNISPAALDDNAAQTLNTMNAEKPTLAESMKKLSFLESSIKSDYFTLEWEAMQADWRSSLKSVKDPQIVVSQIIAFESNLKNEAFLKDFAIHRNAWREQLQMELKK